ncbi:VOC family protein [Streptomyces sp. NPDC058001]|uniref:VOC family protein n=1 Tax=Streptomyces sp. NPDC058001 TaxID=3346300 RepID=UPI0036EA12DA
MRSFSDLFRNFIQLGYVTDDIDAATSYLESSLGTVECVRHYKSSLGGGRPPAGDEPGSSDFVVVDGVPADEWVIDVALVNAGATNIEIIRPVEGAVALYHRGVRPEMPATLHHVAFRVEDFDEASALVTGAGKSWAQYGRSGPIRFGYVDLTAELGHFVEIMEYSGEGTSPFAYLHAASNASRG